MKPEKYCKKIVKQSGSNFYYSFFFLPKRKRRAIYAVYAFSRTIDDVVDKETENSLKEKMLAFWRTEIDRAYEGYSAHPLTRELVYAVREFDIPKEYFVEHLNGVRQDMVQTRYATFEDLKRYCYRVASIVGLICLKIFEVAESENNVEAAKNLGLAFQLTNILRDVGSDADRNRIYLPEEDLEKFSLTDEDILEKLYSDRFVNLMKYEWGRANDLFTLAHKGFDKEAETKLVSAMVMSDVYYQILLRIQDEKYNVFAGKISLTGLEKMELIFRRLICRKA